jgi:hypothetical protein
MKGSYGAWMCLEHILKCECLSVPESKFSQLTSSQQPPTIMQPLNSIHGRTGLVDSSMDIFTTNTRLDLFIVVRR